MVCEKFENFAHFQKFVTNDLKLNYRKLKLGLKKMYNLSKKIMKFDGILLRSEKGLRKRYLLFVR